MLPTDMRFIGGVKVRLPNSRGQFDMDVLLQPADDPAQDQLIFGSVMMNREQTLRLCRLLLEGITKSQSRVSLVDRPD